MALKSVIADSFFDDLANALSRFEATYGRLNLASLNPSHRYRSRWDLAIAADWMDGLSRLQMIGQLDVFPDTESKVKSKIAGATVHNSSDWLVREVLSSVEIPMLGTAYHVTGLDLGERSSDEVVCLLVRPVIEHITSEKAA